jgi:hypothetical protein
MLPFGVTIPATVPQWSEIPEGLMNYPVFVFGLKILVQQLPGEPVHCREEETNCLVLSTRAGHGESSSIGVPEHSNKNFQRQFVPQGQTRGE